MSIRKFISSLFLVVFFNGVACSEDKKTQKHHAFTAVHIAYASDGCSFQASPIDYCDEKHLASINEAIRNEKINFSKHYILISIPEREEYFQKSVVAIDSNTGIVYPIPIDYYSGPATSRKGAVNYGRLKFNLTDNEICIEGTIFVYRAEQTGTFCFLLIEDRFVGYETAYMNEH